LTVVPAAVAVKGVGREAMGNQLASSVFLSQKTSQQYFHKRTGYWRSEQAIGDDGFG
jgi:hypothetical protein